MAEEIPTKELLNQLDGLGSKSGKIACLIINCHVKDKLVFRSAASNDIAEVESTCEKIGIELQGQCNANNASELRDFIEELKSKDFSSYTGIWVVILSHGKEGDIVTFRNQGDFLSNSFGSIKQCIQQKCSEFALSGFKTGTSSQGSLTYPNLN
jgi:hypothetical protein